MGKQLIKKTKGKLTVVDLVFCIDCSFSMIPVIDSIKENVFSLMKGLDEMEIFYWRARIVGFRDDIVYDKPFVSSIGGFKHQLGSIVAQGIVENESSPVIETIEYAVKESKWQKAHKVVMVFTDTDTTVKGGFDIDAFCEELSGQDVILYLWGLEDPVYGLMGKIPHAQIFQLKDPIESYYHNTIDFGDFLESLDPRKDFPIDDDVL